MEPKQRGLAFRLGGIPVRIDPSFWLVMGLFGVSRAVRADTIDWSLAAAWIGLVFTGILAHELGHAVAFRSFGHKPNIVLYAMGGLTHASGQLSPGRRLVSTLAGPFVGLVIGGLALAANRNGLWVPDSTLELRILEDLLFINIGWGILNLVPLYPLDGGQSLEAFLGLLRVKAAAAVTSVVSIVVAAAGGVWAAQQRQVFLVFIAIALGMLNIRRVQALRKPAPAAPASAGAAPGLSPTVARTLEMADQALQQGRQDEAVEMVAQEYGLRPTPQSAEAYAAILARTRSYARGEELLGKEGDRLGAGALLILAGMLVSGGRYASGLRAAEGAWNSDTTGSWRPAVTAAAARAGLRDVDGAVRWLYMATDRGWNDRRRLESDPVFAEVRIDPRITDILARMGV